VAAFRKPLDQEIQATLNGRFFNQVEVVQDQHELAFPPGQRVQQHDPKGLIDQGRGRLEQREQLFSEPFILLPDGSHQVGPETNGVVILGIEGEPGHRQVLAELANPGAGQGGFAISRRRGQERQAVIGRQTLIQQPEQPRPHDQSLARVGNSELSQ
jgi:hypothetical protein